MSVRNSTMTNTDKDIFVKYSHGQIFIVVDKIYEGKVFFVEGVVAPKHTAISLTV